jgi:hypothetical protein
MTTEDTLLPPTRPASWEMPATARARGDGGGSGRARAAAIVIVVVAVLCAAVAMFTDSSTSWYPDDWDARVAPIAAEVATLRGLDFEHAVPVRFLSVAEFEEKVGIDEGALDSEDVQSIEESAALLRSLGLLGGDVDLTDALDTASTSGTLAYYDPDLEEIVVRGENFDID